MQVQARQCAARDGVSVQSKEARIENKERRPIWEHLVDKIKECSKQKDLHRGKLLHSSAVEAGCHNNRYVAHTLISMYSKCGSMRDARNVFESMIQHDAISWTVLMLGYVENGESLIALDVLTSMDYAPDNITFVAALKACASLASENRLDKKTCLEKGMAIHRQAKEHGFEKDVLVSNTLVGMYSKCGSMHDALEVFNGMMHRDVVSWTVLILGYVENDESSLALDLLTSMDCAPNQITFVAALKACTGRASGNELDCLQKGMAIHKLARERGFERNIFVANTLIDMYSKCNSMQDAWDVFKHMLHPDVVSWTALIVGYVENGDSILALDVCANMNCVPNYVTFLAVLKACASLASSNQLDENVCLEKGMAIDRQARNHGFVKDVVVASTLVDMYRKCGSMQDARYVFDNMVHRDVVSWSTLILGYMETGESSVALDMFASMDCTPDAFTYVAVLKACASVGAFETGRRIHDRIREVELGQDETVVYNCLVDFYAKCGDMSAAEEVFNSMHVRNIVSWTSLIGGYSSLGDMSEVFKLVKRMEESGLRMNDVTILLVLNACNHAGMVEEGKSYFESMSKYGISPSVEHYTCMVDMLGRANRLQEALSLVHRMPFGADGAMWMTLLGACRKWSNLEVGEVAFSALVHNKDKERLSAAYVMMGDIYKKLGERETCPRL